VKKLDRTDAPTACEYATVYLAFELSKKTWKVAALVPGGRKMSRYTVAGGNIGELSALLVKLRAKAQAAAGGKLVQFVSCYEAGYDGHWLHRWLTAQGVANHEIDPASIAVNRHSRRVKTDRIDLEHLMRALLAYLRGEPRVCSVLRVPTVEDEDHRQRSRERDHLLEERISHTNRIKGLLHAQGIRDAMPLKPGFVAWLEKVRTGDGRPLPPRLKQEILREHERLCLLEKQIKEVEAQSQEEVRTAAAGSPEAKIIQLSDLKGIGWKIAQGLVHEAYYRDFENRRQVGSYFGMTGTPFDSGASRREQGISKAGNRRARTKAVELAWLWLNHQPGSELSIWFRKRVGNAKGRVKRIAIVALARKLVVALWRYLETGVVPTGAVLHRSF
jgi:transposase